MKKMKKTLFISLLLLFISPIIAQKTINSGYVFIDGKYIEPPYIFNFKNEIIEINGVPVIVKFEKWMGNNPIYLKFPGTPPKTIEKGEESVKFINPLTGKLLLADIVTYYYDKYNEIEASDSIINYICNLTNVECVSKKPLKVRYLELGTNARAGGVAFFTFYDSNNVLKNSNERAKNIISKYNEVLSNNGILFFNNQTLSQTILNDNLLKDTTIFYNKELNINLLNIKLIEIGKDTLIKVKK